MRMRAPIVVESPGIRRDAVGAPQLHGKAHAARLSHTTGLVHITRSATEPRRSARGFSAAGRGPRRSAPSGARAKSGGRFTLALLALLTFLASASSRQVALASAVGPSPQVNLAARDADDHKLAASLRSRAVEPRASTTPEPAHCRLDVAAPPACELEAVEPEGSEEDATLGALGASLTVGFTPTLPIASQDPCITSVAWMTQFWVASALPRGPPFFARAPEGALRLRSR